MADISFNKTNDVACPSDNILDPDTMYDFPYFSSYDWNDYFAAQDLEQAGSRSNNPIIPSLLFTMDEHAYDQEIGSQGPMAAIQAMTFEAARLPLTPQELLPSLDTSAASSQSHVYDSHQPRCITADLAFPQSQHAYTYNDIDAMIGGMEAWADSSASALGLGLGGDVTVPAFGWAVLAPNPEYTSSDLTLGSQRASQYLCSSGEMYHGGFGLAGLSYVSLPSPNTLGAGRPATSVANCIGGSIGLTPPTPAPGAFTISLPHRGLPLPPLVRRSISARQPRVRPNRGFSYVRSEHIKTIADKDKEHFNKTTPWDQEEIRVLNEVSDDYDINFRATMGIDDEMDRILKWKSIVDHVRMALHTSRSRHQILIQAEKRNLRLLPLLEGIDRSNTGRRALEWT